MYLKNYLFEIDSPYVSMGAKYFDEKRVQNLTCNLQGVWSAQITESDNCFVSVKIIDRQVQSSDCTCGFEGLHCIHKVAIYKAILGTLGKEYSVPTETLRTKYLLSYEQQQGWESDLLFQNVAYKIIEQSKIEDEDQINFQLAYDQQLIEAIERAKTEPIEAFSLVMTCYKLSFDLKVNANKIKETMKRVIAAIQDKQIAKKIEKLLQIIGPVSTLLKTEKGTKFYFMILIELSPILQSSEQVKEIINQTDVQVNPTGIPKLNENNKKRLKEFYLVKLALKNNNYEDIKLYYTKKFVSSDACLLIVNYACEKQDFEEALSLCLKAVDQPIGDGSIEKFLKKIIEIYGIRGEIEKQRHYGYKLALKNGNLNQLKILYKENPELWNDIFLELKGINEIDDFCVFILKGEGESWKRKSLQSYDKLETRYKELMSYCVGQPQYTITYAMELRQYDRNKVISLVSSYLEKEMAEAKTRVKYCALANELKHFMEAGYYEEAQKIKDIFMNLYPKRIAMIEELEKAVGEY